MAPFKRSNRSEARMTTGLKTRQTSRRGCFAVRVNCDAIRLGSLFWKIPLEKRQQRCQRAADHDTCS